MTKSWIIWTLGAMVGVCLHFVCCTPPCPSAVTTSPWPPLRLVVEDLPVEWGLVVDRLLLDFPGIEVSFPGWDDPLPPGTTEVRVTADFHPTRVGEAYIYEGSAVVFASTIDRYCVFGAREQGLANTIAHEYGHLIGWEHTEDPCSVMLSVFKYDSCVVDRSTLGLPDPVLQRRDHGATTISEGEGVPSVPTPRVCN